MCADKNFRRFRISQGCVGPKWRCSKGNQYAYVGGNPVRFIDPLGLTQADIDCLYGLAKEKESDLEFPDGDPIVKDLGVNELGQEIVGEYRFGPRFIPTLGRLYVDDQYLAQLNPQELVSLYNTIVHEVMHKDLGPASGTDPLHHAVRLGASERALIQSALIQSRGACGCKK